MDSDSSGFTPEPLSGNNEKRTRVVCCILPESLRNFLKNLTFVMSQRALTPGPGSQQRPPGRVITPLPCHCLLPLLSPVSVRLAVTSFDPQSELVCWPCKPPTGLSCKMWSVLPRLGEDELPTCSRGRRKWQQQQLPRLLRHQPQVVSAGNLISAVFYSIKLFQSKTKSVFSSNPISIESPVILLSPPPSPALALPTRDGPGGLTNEMSDAVLRKELWPVAEETDAEPLGP